MRFNPAYPAMLAHDWNKKGQPDPKGYWASEKYDGLRALWDGENFYSRNGKIFHAPQWFKDTLPNTPLDGELWLERSVAGYQKAVSAVRKKVGGKEWENITYMVFDIPTSTEPFEKVQAKLKRMNLGRYGEVVPQYKVKSKSDMLKHYEAALAEGAEGIMLREPGSRYTATRSASLLKVKPEDTAEAVVTGYQEGTGKHQGRMGAVHVYLLGDKSKVFKIGTGFKDYQRESPPPIGSIVEFKFNDKTARGIPRFPAFLRIRTDMMDDRPKRKAAKPARKKTMAKKFKWPKYGSKKYTSSFLRAGNPHLQAGGWTYYPDKVGPFWLSDTFEDTAFYTHKDGDDRDRIRFEMNHKALGNAPKGSFTVTHPEEMPLFYPSMNAALNAMISGDPAAGKPFRAPPPSTRKVAKRKAEKLHPQEWARRDGEHILDPDGWRVKGAPPFDSLHTQGQYRKWVRGSTIGPIGPTTRQIPKSARRKPAAKSSRTAADYFSMSKGQLVASGDAGAKKELKRRGRDARGNKVG
jgi:DNA ligase-1